MTMPRDSTGIPALDELGRRLETAGARPRHTALRPRRAATLATVGLVTLVGTPAIALSGVFSSGHKAIEDALPQVAAIVDRNDDPTATGRELERRGFKVRWQLIIDNPDRGRPGASPTLGRDVPAPPPGTEILALLNSTGGNTATADTRSLLIEISPAGSAILKTHR